MYVFEFSESIDRVHKLLGGPKVGQPTLELVEETKREIKHISDYPLGELAEVAGKVEDKFGGSPVVSEGLEWAKLTVRLMRTFNLDSLPTFPADDLTNIKNICVELASGFQLVKELKPVNGQDVQDAFLRLGGYYRNHFKPLTAYITFTIMDRMNVNALESEARSAYQAVSEEIEKVREGLEEHKASAEKILENIRLAASDTSISVEAKHFQNEELHHSQRAVVWFRTTVVLSLVLIVAAFLSLFLHFIPGLAPRDTLQAYQLVASKVLIFGALSYLLLLSGKNFMSHKHNAVVNRHRQNALMTFRALVDRAQDPKVKEVVLTHAASCIFSPQDTGYTKHSGASSLSPGKILDAVMKSDHS